MDGFLNFYYCAPGLKYYPFGQKKITYAIGLNVTMGYGVEKGTRYSHNPATYNNPKFGAIKRTAFKMGTLLNNYLNVQFGHSFNMGVILGMGVRYMNHVKETNVRIAAPAVYYSYPTQFLGHAALEFGFRF